MQLSPPALLSLTLFFIGMILKRSPISDWMIPLILAVLGGLIFPYIAETGKLNYQVRNPFLLHSLFGVALGAVPTWAKESLKQIRERPKTAEGKTEFMTKSVQ